MQKYYQIRSLVKWFLENEIETRNSDELLVALVDARISPAVKTSDYVSVMKNRPLYGLPAIETITRARREWQEECPELKGLSRVDKQRKRREQKMRAYFSERVVDGE